MFPNDRSDFPLLSYSSTSEIPTLIYYLRPDLEPSRLGHYEEYPTGIILLFLLALFIYECCYVSRSVRCCHWQLKLQTRK